MKKNSPLIIAHRGASAEAPENTIAAIQRAIDLNVDGIEFDIYFSKDKIPVVVHDESPQRTTNLNQALSIESLTLNEIKTFDAGSWFAKKFSSEKIPTLEEILLLKRGTIQLMIEIKQGTFSPSETIPYLINMLDNIPIEQKGSLYFGSFDFHILKELKKQAPSLKLIGILEDLNMITEFKKLHINHFTICSTLITSDLIDVLHKEKSLVWTYTVDEEHIATSFTSYGIDGIITNDPRRLKSFLI